jgi:hypothetical protein
MKSLEFLLEYDRGKTAAAYGDKILAVATKDRWLVDQIAGRNRLGMTFPEAVKKDPAMIIDAILAILERGDPTPNKEYTQAIAKMYGNGLSKAEDVVSTLADYLAKFDKLKRRKKIQPPRNDFNRYKSLEDFMDVVDEYPDEEAESKPEEKKNATELYRDNQLIVTIPNDVEAACYYGQGTRWCTAGKNNNMYDYYTRGDRPLYVIIPRQQAYPGEKYQFHFETKQFMNEQDRQIGDDGMKKLVKRFPVLTKILQKPAEQFMIPALLSAEYKNIVIEATPEVQKATTQLIDQYADRIIAFGFKSLDGYGVQLPDSVKQELSGDMRDYLAQCVKAMGSFWKQLSGTPELARDEDKIESMLSTNRELQAVAEQSTVVAKLKDALAQSGQKIHKDAMAHIVELTVRDPLFRFMMKQVAKQYTAKLQEQGHALQ